MQRMISTVIKYIVILAFVFSVVGSGYQAEAIETNRNNKVNRSLRPVIFTTDAEIERAEMRVANQRPLKKSNVLNVSPFFFRDRKKNGLISCTLIRGVI